MGNATFSKITRLSIGGRDLVVSADLTMSSSYATSGDTIDLTQLPLNGVFAIMIPGAIGAATTMQWDLGTKVVAYAGASQVANATDLSGVVVRCLIFGK